MLFEDGNIIIEKAGQKSYREIMKTGCARCFVISLYFIIKERLFFMVNRFILNETSYHGANAIASIADEAKARGFKKAFVCSDPDL